MKTQYCKKHLLIFFFICLQFSYLQAEPENNKSIIQVISNDIQDAINDELTVIGSINNFSQDNLSVLLGTAAFSALSSTSEKSIRNFVLTHRSAENDNLFKTITSFGDAKYPMFLAGSVYLGGLITGENEIRKTGRLLFESMLLSGVTTTLIKSLLGRARPYTGQGNYNFDLFSLNDDHLSLPSGHATVAFAAASVLSFKIDKWWGYIGFYSLAGLVGVSRVYLDRHWLSDVIIGAAIGTASGVAVCNAQSKKSISTTGRFIVYPAPAGLGFCYIF